jgi:hypothetical protein
MAALLAMPLSFIGLIIDHLFPTENVKRAG